MLNKIRQVSLIPELRFPSKRYAGFHYSGFMVYFAPVYSVCARLRYVATKEWGTKRNLNMKHLYEKEKENELKREKEKDGKNGNVA